MLLPLFCTILWPPYLVRYYVFRNVNRPISRKQCSVRRSDQRNKRPRADSGPVRVFPGRPRRYTVPRRKMYMFTSLHGYFKYIDTDLRYLCFLYVFFWRSTLLTGPFGGFGLFQFGFRGFFSNLYGLSGANRFTPYLTRGFLMGFRRSETSAGIEIGVTQLGDV